MKFDIVLLGKAGMILRSETIMPLAARLAGKLSLIRHKRYARHTVLEIWFSGFGCLVTTIYCTLAVLCLSRLWSGCEIYARVR